MLERINLQDVESSDGYRLQIVDRGQLEYSLGTKRLIVDFEPGFSTAGSPDVVVYLGAVTAWEPPFEDEAISADLRPRIAQNIHEALLFLGTDCEIV